MYKVTQHKNKTQQNKGDEDNKEVHCGFNRSSNKAKTKRRLETTRKQEWSYHRKREREERETKGGEKREKEMMALPCLVRLSYDDRCDIASRSLSAS
jgi:hypothetical protein